MLNIEKYKNKLIELGVINIAPLARLNLNGKLEEKHTGPRYSRVEIEDWLFSEYEEPPVDWSKVKVDTPILVKEYELDEWKPRYFAKYEKGFIYSFTDGKTLWSAREGETIAWKYAKLAESEEQEDDN